MNRQTVNPMKRLERRGDFWCFMFWMTFQMLFVLVLAFGHALHKHQAVIRHAIVLER
jgi:hypothetical protein